MAGSGPNFAQTKVIIETATTIGTKYLASVGQFCIGALERLAELPFAQFAKEGF
jgi:hypothetical protein